MKPFLPGEKIPLKLFWLMDKEDRGLYFREDQPVFDQEEADRLWEKYKQHIKSKGEH